LGWAAFLNFLLYGVAWPTYLRATYACLYADTVIISKRRSGWTTATSCSFGSSQRW